MGTPLEIKVPRVRVNRATAIFRIRMPSTGKLQDRRVNGISSLRSAVPDL